MQSYLDEGIRILCPWGQLKILLLLLLLINKIKRMITVCLINDE